MVSLLVDFPIAALYKKYDEALVNLMTKFTFQVVYNEMTNLENQLSVKTRHCLLDLIKTTPFNLLESLRLFDLEECVPSLALRKHTHENFDYDDCIKCAILEELTVTCNQIALDVLDLMYFIPVIYDRLLVTEGSLKLTVVDEVTVKNSSLIILKRKP